MPSFLPKALCFKEWKEHRWWMVTALVLLVYQPVYELWGFLVSGKSSNSQGLFWQVLLPTIYHSGVVGNQYPTKYLIHANPVAGMFAGFVALGLGIALFTVERNRGTLWFVFSGPVRRLDQFRVKLMFATSIVILTLIFKVVLLCVCDVASGTLLPLSVVWSWGALNLVYELALMAVGMACATVIMIGFHAGIAAVILAAIPWATGKSVYPRPIEPFPGNQVPFAATLGKFLESLSPLTYSGGMTLTSGAPDSFPLIIANGVRPMGWVSLWFVGWIIGWLWLAYRAYKRTPIENNAHFFMFPMLWRWTLWFAVGVVSYVSVNGYASYQPDSSLLQTPYALLSRVIFVWVMLGLIVDLGVRAYLRNRARWRFRGRT